MQALDSALSRTHSRRRADATGLSSLRLAEQNRDQHSRDQLQSKRVDSELICLRRNFVERLLIVSVYVLTK